MKLDSTKLGPLQKKHTVGFKCASSSACRTLWRYSVEQRIFFTFRSSADIPAVVTGGSFFSRGSKVRYCGRVERELSGDFDAAEPVAIPSSAQQQPTTTSGGRASANQRQLMTSSTGGLSSLAAVAAAAARNGGGGVTAVGGGGVRAQREAFASRRSASEPVNRDYADQDDDCCDEDEDEDEDEDSLVYESMAAVRGKRLLGAPGGRRPHHTEDGSTASAASTKTSSLIPEGQDDSYEASSCGSDDRSDVASWVALDLRGLRGQQRRSNNNNNHHPHHHTSRQQQQQQQQRNGYDTTTIDSDFYGYAPSQTGSAADSWTLRSHNQDSWRDHHSAGSNSRGSRHSVSPARYPYVFDYSLIIQGN